MPPPELKLAPPASPLALTLIPVVLTLVGPAAIGVSTDRRRPPPSVRRNISRARKGLYRCTAMSRLFSNTSAITSRTDK
jgi:hypothetical protein